MSIVQSFLPAALLLFLSVDLWAAPVDAVGAEALAAGFLQSRKSVKLMSPGLLIPSGRRPVQVVPITMCLTPIKAMLLSSWRVMTGSIMF